MPYICTNCNKEIGRKMMATKCWSRIYCSRKCFEEKEEK